MDIEADDEESAVLRSVAQAECEADHLFFTRYFFKHRQAAKFRVNWHHHYIADTIEKVIRGEIKNVIFNVPPGSSKTELVVINLIARGLALNPWCRFLHLSYSDDLALLNSQQARELISGDAFQELWPLQIADDAKAKKRWNVMHDGVPAGGVYAASLGGQITGFRAGHMRDGFNGAIIIDDPLKPEDASSKVKLDAANRKLITTVKSRKANPDTPIIVIMQRIAENDPTGFILNGNITGEWNSVVIPAIMDDAALLKLPEKYRDMAKAQAGERIDGRFSYWSYKEPIEELIHMERGSSADSQGARVSRSVFAAQYMQNPVAIGGNMVKGSDFKRWSILPPIKYRVIFGDTASKANEWNDFSVFQCWGHGEDGRLYLIDQVRGRWTSPDLKRQAVDFWNKHKGAQGLGLLREMAVEDKASGTPLIQEIQADGRIPIRGIPRNKDKVSRLNDVLPQIQSGYVSIPDHAPWVSDFITECEAFSPDMTHAHDDQLDPMIDAIVELRMKPREAFTDSFLPKDAGFKVNQGAW